MSYSGVLMRIPVLLLLAGLILLSGANGSFARDWIVERVAGTVWSVEEGREPVKLQRQMQVRVGATIKTLGNGRVRMVNAKNAMTMSPNSLATITRDGWLFGARTRVLQEKGTIEFEVETRGRPHFEVKTPYLAAVVKGTKFTVSVTATSGTVAVARGLVGVTDAKSGQSADVGAGQKASASATSGGLSTSASANAEVGQSKSTDKTTGKSADAGKDTGKGNSSGNSGNDNGNGNSGNGNGNSGNGNSGKGGDKGNSSGNNGDGTSGNGTGTSGKGNSGNGGRGR